MAWQHLRCGLLVIQGQVMSHGMFWKSVMLSAAMGLTVLPPGSAWAKKEKPEDAGSMAEGKGQIDKGHKAAGHKGEGKPGDGAAAAGHAAEAGGEVSATAAGGGKVDPAARMAEVKKRHAERGSNRAERAKASRDKMREKASKILHAKAAGKDRAAAEPMVKALKQELKRHARRVARLDRVAVVAAEAGDAATLARADALMFKERERHERWMNNYGAHGGAALRRAGQWRVHGPLPGRSGLVSAADTTHSWSRQFLFHRTRTHGQRIGHQ
jgi:hypothetical protein